MLLALFFDLLLSDFWRITVYYGKRHESNDMLSTLFPDLLFYDSEQITMRWYL